jgi:CheY-like chemotaxis protein
MRALIVEDDATIAEFVGRGLREAGFAVDHAGDGEQGLGLASSGAYDVAIVDLMLPKRDGLTLIQAMRRQDVRTPVLILSAKPHGRRPRAGPRVGRRRLPHQAVRVCRAAGARAGAHPPVNGRPGSHAPDRRRPHARPAHPARDARRGASSSRCGQARVRPARVPDAQCRPGRLEDDDPLARLGLQLRPGTNVVDVLVFRLREKIDGFRHEAACRPFEVSAMSSRWRERLRHTFGFRSRSGTPSSSSAARSTLVVSPTRCSLSLRQYDRRSSRPRWCSTRTPTRAAGGRARAGAAAHPDRRHEGAALRAAVGARQDLSF